MTGRLPFVRLLMLSTLVCACSVSAQDRWLSQIYGRGVHAYHRGNYSEAIQLLDQAIHQGLQDPRAYYFRGLSRLRCGDSLGAESDIRTGATIEVAGAGTFDIGQALERVQGNDRLRFESVRSEAATLALRERALRGESDATTVTPPVRPERDYLRTPPALERMRDPAVPQPAGPDQSDPFMNEQPLDERLEVPAPGQVAPPAQSEPSPFEADPFGGQAPLDETPAPDEGDPFQDDPAADIFGDTLPDMGTTESGSVEDDIFGGPAPAPQTVSPTPPAPAPAPPSDSTPAPATGGTPAEVDGLDDIFSGDPDDVFDEE